MAPRWRECRASSQTGAGEAPTSSPAFIFKGWLEGSLVEHALSSVSSAANSTKNQAGVLFELMTRGVVEKSRTASYYTFCEQNNGLGGTYWDEFVTMELHGIAHFRSGSENRWASHPRYTFLRAVWITPTAMQGMCF